MEPIRLPEFTIGTVTVRVQESDAQPAIACCPDCPNGATCPNCPSEGEE